MSRGLFGCANLPVRREEISLENLNRERTKKPVYRGRVERGRATVPHEYTVSPVPEFVLGVDTQGLWLHMTAGEFHRQVQVVKAILQTHANSPPIQLPPP